MKRLTAIALIGAIAISIPVYADSEKNRDFENISESINETEEPEIAEALETWRTEQSGLLTDEAENALTEALEGLVGAEYEPICLLAEQISAGTNYAILCRVTPVVPDAVSSYSVVYVYEDPDGKAEFVRTEDLTDPEDETVEGGWASIDSDESETAGRAREALEKSLEEMVGADYEVVTALAYQVVAGENYQLLCRITPVYPDAEGTYNIVEVFEDLEGVCEITSIRELEYSLQ